MIRIYHEARVLGNEKLEQLQRARLAVVECTGCSLYAMLLADENNIIEGTLALTTTLCHLTTLLSYIGRLFNISIDNVFHI